MPPLLNATDAAGAPDNVTALLIQERIAAWSDQDAPVGPERR